MEWSYRQNLALGNAFFKFSIFSQNLLKKKYFLRLTSATYVNHFKLRSKVNMGIRSELIKPTKEDETHAPARIVGHPPIGCNRYSGIRVTSQEYSGQRILAKKNRQNLSKNLKIFSLQK